MILHYLYKLTASCKDRKMSRN